MPTLLGYILKFLGLALGIVLIVAWFYAYAETKVKGFVLIALAGVLKFVGWLLIAVLFAFTSVKPPAIFLIAQTITLAIDIVSVFLTIWGIFSIIDRLRRDNH